MVKNKVVLKKASLDFWEGEEIQLISTRMCTKNTCQTWGGEMIVHAKKFKT